MFGEERIRLLVAAEARNANYETFACNENVISPKDLAQGGKTAPADMGICFQGAKKSRTQRCGSVNYLFLLLPRMVASGLAACFMKAEGLMPTMFLNCLEKW